MGQVRMESVEAVVAHIQALSGSHEEVADLHSLLKQSEGALRSRAARLGPFLHQLDPSAHTLGYLFLLEAYSSRPISREQDEKFLPFIVGFINSCSAEQIRLAPEKFISVCKSFKDQVMQLQVPIRGITPLRTAIRKLQTSSEQLTTLHSDYLLLCLLAKFYKAGLSILDDDIFEVDQPRDHFLYCYYGGMINIGLKRFRKALGCLHNVVTAPMDALSVIAVEAYKKYILVSLILNGQVPPFPKYTSSTAQRNLKRHTQVFINYVEYFTLHALKGSFILESDFIGSNMFYFKARILISNDTTHTGRYIPAMRPRCCRRLLIRVGIRSLDGEKKRDDSTTLPLFYIYIYISSSMLKRTIWYTRIQHFVNPKYLWIFFWQPYIDLADCYATGTFSELEACIQTNLEKFQSDSNVGLVKQVLSSLYKHNIQRLTQTYLTLSLQDIANASQLKTPNDAEMHVLQMIQDAEISASINQKDGMVSFHEDPEQYKICGMIEPIDSLIQRLMELSKKLSSLDEQISCDLAHLTRIGKERPRLD
ncbi:unnamed protein product [Musa banksii]